MFSGPSLFIFAPFDVQGSDMGGTCGVFNNDTSDDLLTRPGTLTTNETEFINSWSVSISDI